MTSGTDCGGRKPRKPSIHPRTQTAVISASDQARQGMPIWLIRGSIKNAGLDNGGWSYQIRDRFVTRPRLPTSGSVEAPNVSTLQEYQFAIPPFVPWSYRENRTTCATLGHSLRLLMSENKAHLVLFKAAATAANATVANEAIKFPPSRSNDKALRP